MATPVLKRLRYPLGFLVSAVAVLLALRALRQTRQGSEAPPEDPPPPEGDGRPGDSAGKMRLTAGAEGEPPAQGRKVIAGAEGEPPARGRKEPPIDHAAIFGAALAAIIVLVVGEGAWDPVGTAIGLLLFLVIVGFYEVPPDVSVRQAVAVGAVVAACVSVALAWPLQQTLSTWQPFGQTAVKECEKREANQYADKEKVVGECKGDATTRQLGWLAGPAMMIATGTILVLDRRAAAQRPVRAGGLIEGA